MERGLQSARLMHQPKKSTHHPGLSHLEVVVLLLIGCCIIGMLFVATVVWKRESDKSANIMNLRNCQQAMRGHEGMNNLQTGKPFTKADLVTYMPFPKDVNAEVTYTPGDKITPQGTLWLRVSPPGDLGGTYGPDPHQIADW
jgi:hypothetical protein